MTDPGSEAQQKEREWGADYSVYLGWALMGIRMYRAPQELTSAQHG